MNSIQSSIFLKNSKQYFLEELGTRVNLEGLLQCETADPRTLTRIFHDDIYKYRVLLFSAIFELGYSTLVVEQRIHS